MSGVRGTASGNPRNPVLSPRRHTTVGTDPANERDHQPVGNGRWDHDEPERESIEEHRETVVRRLLARGLSPTTVATLLPDFRHLVERLAEDD